MPSRQLSERRHEHSLFDMVIGEARKPESVGAPAQGCCGVNVSAEIQAFNPINGVFRFMAQPETAKSAGWMLRQGPQMQTAVMIAADQKHFGIQPAVQVAEICPQPIREAEPAVNQVSKDDDSLRLPLITKSLQSLQGGSVVITGQRNAARLEDLSLAQVKVGDKQFLTGWSPDGFLCKQNQLLIPPLPPTERTVRLFIAVFDVDGSQQSASRLRFEPFCSQTMKVFEMRIRSSQGVGEWPLCMGDGTLRMHKSIDF